MPGLLQTAIEFLRLRGSPSLFDRGYSIQFELDGLRRPIPISPAGLLIKKDICYHPEPGKNRSLQSLDVYAPASTLPSPHPVVLFMHGGGWRASDKDDQLGVHANVCKALAARGLVAVNVNYRLAPRVKHPEPARDAAHAFRWIRENIDQYHGDPKKVFVSGHSAGGHLAALIALDPDYLDEVGLSVTAISGVIGICGIYNLAHFARRNWMAEHLMTRAAFGKDSTFRAQASPVNHVRADAPPFLLLNAQQDEKLEEEADELSCLLRTNGVSAETGIITGTNHFTLLSLVGNGDDRLIDRIVEFAK
ncbi:MAG: alpha/beta hydrolase [Pyrinomonadaceae bacterium]|nr:alpha/beta hydrolase [Pyrinomonadaceae bacterium]